MGLITLVGLITISASTYMIIYSHPLYEWLAPWLKVFERQHPYREIDQDTVSDDGMAQIILFGMGRYGLGIARALRARGSHVLAVDYNPELVRSGDPMGYPVLYGDAEDPEFIASLPYARTQWIVCTARDLHVSQALIHSLRSLGYAGQIAVTAHSPAEVVVLEHAGADLVLVPFVDAAREAADRLLGQGPSMLPV
jgi:Trk K+ transport system NAD-binding subunit